MDYEKKYKQLQGFISDLYPFMSEYCKEKVEGFLPELKESEDERIRKEIIAFIKSVAYAKIDDVKRYVAWLEKQANHANFCNKIQIGDKVTRNRDGVLVNLSQLNRVAKPADKVKPKFKVGDWVTNGLCEWRIDSIDEDMYYTNHCGIDCGGDIESIDKEYHLWTIQDANDGDVLAIDPWSDYPSSFVAIYKKQNGEDFDSYCFVGFDGKFYKGENGHSTEEIHPATKEQRDLLFQKMKEAGYEWDAENKELKKIHIIDEGKSEMDYCFTKMMNGEKISSALNEEDEHRINLLEALCENKLIEHVPNSTLYKEIRITIDWLKLLKERVQPKQEWNKEDEERIKNILSVLDVQVCWDGATGKKGNPYQKEIDWINSLKFHNHWKPSDEQMQAFEQVYDWYNNNFAQSETLTSLYNDLKKLT